MTHHKLDSNDFVGMSRHMLPSAYTIISLKEKGVNGIVHLKTNVCLI